MTVPWKCAVTIVVALAVSCSRDQRQNTSIPEFSDGNLWELAEVPAYSVTASSGEPSFILHGVSHGYLFEDGSAVVSTRSRELVYFDSLGSALKVAGGGGSGPGEFGVISRIVGTGGGIGVWDMSSGRLSHFGKDGAYLFGTTLPAFRPLLGHIAGAGAIAVATSIPAGQRRSYEIWSDTGEFSSTLQGAPEPPTDVLSWNVSLSPEMRASRVAAGFPDSEVTNMQTPLSSRCVATSGEAVIDTLLFAMDANGGTVSSHSVSGESRTIYEARERQYVTEQLYSEVLQILVASSGPTPAPIDTVDAALRKTLEVEAALPAWTGLVGDPSGRLWLRTYKCTTDSSDEDTYGIIDTQGNVLGRISLPIAWRLLAVRGERLLIVRRDELGVEHVELHYIIG